VEEGVSREELTRRALAEPAVAQHVNGKSVVKTVVVPNRLVSIVVR